MTNTTSNSVSHIGTSIVVGAAVEGFGAVDGG